MSELFQTLTDAFSQSPIPAMLAAFIWGICSMVLSPCHLAGIPLIIAYVNEQEAKSPRQAANLSLLFALGMFLMIALIGAVTALAGKTAGDLGTSGYYVLTAVFLIVGLDLLDVISIRWFKADKENIKVRGAAGALLLGLIFGFASGPCTFAFLAPILAVTFQAATSSILLGIALLVFFGIGHCLVIVLAGSSAGYAQRFVDWQRKTRTFQRVRKLLGALLILAGFYFLYRAI